MDEDSLWIDISVPLTAGMVRYPGDPAIDVSCNFGQDPDGPVVSYVSLCVHAGTHVDAPLHYRPNAKSIDLMPPTAMIGPARVIGITDPHVVSVQELEGQRISPGERILFKTQNSSLWQLDFFVEEYVYLSTDGAAFLAEKGILAVGIDYLSIGGFHKNEQVVHRTLLEAGVWIIEGVDLSGIEPGAYDLVCMPLRIRGAEAAPARVMVRPRPRTAPERT